MTDSTIVVVEDDPIQRSDTVAMLDASGLDVVDFATADEALDFLEERRGDVAGVLTDIHMPGRLDGFDLAVKITMSWPDVTVLMTSGQPRPASLLLLSVAFLPKPWLALDVIVALQDAAKARKTRSVRGADLPDQSKRSGRGTSSESRDDRVG